MMPRHRLALGLLATVLLAPLVTATPTSWTGGKGGSTWTGDLATRSVGSTQRGLER